jgi:hypothetical protein
MGHTNYGDHSNHGNHGNHNSSIITTSEILENTGEKINLSWENWDSQSLDETYASSSIDNIKELRDKIYYLQQNKSGDSGELDNPSVNFTGAEDHNFNDNDPSTPEYIDDVQYDTIKNQFEKLYEHMKNETKTLPGAEEGEKIEKNKIEIIRAEIDQLAGYDTSAAYTNHNNHESHASYSNTVHSSHNNRGGGWFG